MQAPLPKLIALILFHLLSSAHTFLAAMSDRAALLPSCTFSQPSEPLICADSRERRAWVNNKGLVFDLQIELAEAWVSSSNCTGKKGKRRILKLLHRKLLLETWALELRARKRDVTETQGRPISTSLQIQGDRWLRNKTRTNVCRSLVQALLTFSMTFRKHPRKSREKGWAGGLEQLAKGSWKWRVGWNKKDSEAQRRRSAALIKEN